MRLKSLIYSIIAVAGLVSCNSAEVRTGTDSLIYNPLHKCTGYDRIGEDGSESRVAEYVWDNGQLVKVVYFRRDGSTYCECGLSHDSEGRCTKAVSFDPEQPEDCTVEEYNYTDNSCVIKIYSPVGIDGSRIPEQTKLQKTVKYVFEEGVLSEAVSVDEGVSPKTTRITNIEWEGGNIVSYLREFEGIKDNVVISYGNGYENFCKGMVSADIDLISTIFSANIPARFEIYSLDGNLQSTRDYVFTADEDGRILDTRLISKQFSDTTSVTSTHFRNQYLD